MVQEKIKPLRDLMRMFSLFLLVGITGINTAFALFQEEEKVTSFVEYRGKVLNSENEKPLVFATLTVENSNISTVTNTEGKFLLKVPRETKEAFVLVSFLGFTTRVISLNLLSKSKIRILMTPSTVNLPEVSLIYPKDITQLVRETLKKRGENYFNTPVKMTGFYRETIKKRKKNVSLSEAVVNIYKMPYTSSRKDIIQLYKSRKNTDYSKLDTIALKLQGGPFNTLFIDIMKYPQYIFDDEVIQGYEFTFDRFTMINDNLIYIIDFKQRKHITEPLYKGKLYIDVQNKALITAIYSLNITDRDKSSRLFVRKKPKNVKVWPRKVAYRVNYREKDGKWYYGYSNVFLEFKVKWDKKLFNSIYRMSCEMAITDWDKNSDKQQPKRKEKMKTSIILGDEAIGFADPDFWGEYNIIEPEKSIESAIKKIQRQLKKINKIEASSL